MSDDTTKKEKLTVKQQLFVKELVTNPNQTQKEALVKAGYNPTTPASARQMAHEIFNMPKIQSAIQEEIERRYPDFSGLAADVLYQGLVNPEIPYKEKLKAVELAAKFLSWIAPTKHASLYADVTKPIEDKFKLPGSED